MHFHHVYEKQYNMVIESEPWHPKFRSIAHLCVTLGHFPNHFAPYFSHFGKKTRTFFSSFHGKNKCCERYLWSLMFLHIYPLTIGLGYYERSKELSELEAPVTRLFWFLIDFIISSWRWAFSMTQEVKGFFAVSIYTIQGRTLMVLTWVMFPSLNQSLCPWDIPGSLPRFTYLWPGAETGFTAKTRWKGYKTVAP